MRSLIITMCLGASTFALGPTSSAQSKPGGAPAKPAPAAPAQPPARLTVAQIMDRQLSNLESDLVPLAEAMPEDKYSFAPTQGEFKGVRTFALQVKHVANTNYAIFAALLGEKLPPTVDVNAENGSDKVTSKADIVKLLKESFTIGHRAMNAMSESTLTDRLPDPSGGNNPGPTRLGAASLTIWHSFDHYGQMVEYARMNGIVPPASRPRK